MKKSTRTSRNPRPGRKTSSLSTPSPARRGAVGAGGRKSKAAATPREPIPGHVLRQLRQFILDHDLKAGDRLPTERELALNLGVSRNSVREALTSLEAVGAVSRRPKIGCVLQPVDLSMLAEVVQFQLLRDDNDLAQLFVARRLLEESVLPLAVANATQEDLAVLRQLLVDFDEAQARDEPLHDLDVAFHRALFAAAHNKFLYQFGSLIQVFFSQARRRIRANVDRVVRTSEEHRAIVDAIERRDAQAAQEHLQAHLGNYLTSGTIVLDHVKQP